MADKLLVEIDLLNNEVEDAVPALVFLTNQLYEGGGAFAVGNRSNWNEKKDAVDYEMKWRISGEDEFVETIPVELDTLLQLQTLLANVVANSTPDSERLVFLRKRIEDLVKSANMTLLCDRAA